MTAPTPISPVHYYDTRRHVIICGVRGFDQRSTKHSRSVTCDACVGLLGDRDAADEPRGTETAAQNAAP